jgi:hypothetical protein
MSVGWPASVTAFSSSPVNSGITGHEDTKKNGLYWLSNCG